MHERITERTTKLMATLGRKIASWVSNLSYGDLDSQTIHEVKRRVIDSIGCALGAYHSQPGKITRALAESRNDTRAGYLFGTTHSTSPELAAALPSPIL